MTLMPDNLDPLSELGHGGVKIFMVICYVPPHHFVWIICQIKTNAEFSAVVIHQYVPRWVIGMVAIMLPRVIIEVSLVCYNLGHHLLDCI